MKTSHRCCLLILAIVLVCSPTASADELDKLFDEWKTGQFTSVIPKLRAYRKQPYGRTPQVDYLLATSLCRVGDAHTGKNYYFSLLANYQLSAEIKNEVRKEMDRCPSSATARPDPIAFASVGTAQAGYSGKMFYVDGLDELSVAENVKVINEVAEEEFQRRLFKPSQINAAVEQAKVRIRDGKANRLEDNYQSAPFDRFVIVCPAQWDTNAVASVGRQLNAYYDYYMKTYKLRAPEFLITAYLVQNRWEMQNIGRLLHGIEIPNDAIGYTFRNDFSVTAYVPVSLFLGTTAHELFHMLVRNDFGDIPAWLDEGIAALYETSAIDENGDVRPIGNWRREIMRKSHMAEGEWSRLRKPAISDLLAMSWQEFNVDGEDGASQELGRGQQALNHATARSFILYLHEQDKLVGVFDSFRSLDVEQIELPLEAHSRRVLSKQLERSIADIDREFEEWVKTYIER